MKKIIIITLFALTNPYLQSADWISNNLPQRWRVEPKWRDQVKIIQEKTGTSVPIIFKNSNNKALFAQVANFGIGSFRLAVMNINQTKLSSCRPAIQIRYLAHETVHIDKSHGIQYQNLSLIMPLLISTNIIITLTKNLIKHPSAVTAFTICRHSIWISRFINFSNLDI